MIVKQSTKPEGVRFDHYRFEWDAACPWIDSDHTAHYHSTSYFERSRAEETFRSQMSQPSVIRGSLYGYMRGADGTVARSELTSRPAQPNA